MTTTKKPFDVGIYTYRPTMHGALQTQDETKLCTGDIVALLHPTQQVDPQNLYCFGVSLKHGTLTILKKNVRFNKILSLKYDKEDLQTATQELHAKLNIVQAYVKKQYSDNQPELV